MLVFFLEGELLIVEVERLNYEGNRLSVRKNVSITTPRRPDLKYGRAFSSKVELVPQISTFVSISKNAMESGLSLGGDLTSFRVIPTVYFLSSRAMVK